VKDFKQFLDKVLAPIHGGSPAQPVPDTAKSAVPADLKEGEIKQRYVEAINAFYDDALERDATQIFADVLAWKLAAIAYHNGPQAAGDIIRKFGRHLSSIAAAENAQREARQAKRAGRRPN
jgi:hypothetical protein